MMDSELDRLKSNAAGATTEELHNAINWNKALADHFDENMNFAGYDMVQERIQVLRAELDKRGK